MLFTRWTDGWCFKKYDTLHYPKINIKNRHFKSLEMINFFFWEIAGLSKGTPHSVTYAAVITFYANSMLFAYYVIVFCEGFFEGNPVIGRYAVIRNA